MQEKFSFDSAFMHFRHTQGPPGFMWKYILIYTVVISLVLCLFYVPFFTTFFGIFADVLTSDSGNPDISADQITRLILTMLVAFPLFLIAYLVVASMFEAAALRRYLRHEGFKLKLGADEFRIMGVLLMWALFFVAVYIIYGVVMAALMVPLIMSGGDANMPLLMALMQVLQFLLYIPLAFFGVRLSPASAITMRDEKITFFGAWSATKGRFWPILGAFLVIYLIVYAIQIFGMIIGMIPMAGGFISFISSANPGSNPEDFLALLTNPLMILGFILLLLIYTGSMAFAHFAFLGITSKVARTDPKWTNPATVDTFD